MYHSAVCRFVTTGIVITGTGLIAATPVAAPPASANPVPVVQLTSGIGDLVTPYTNLVTNTWHNLSAIGTDWFADPFPFLHQILVNQVGYAQDIFSALLHGDLPGFGQALLDAGTGMWHNFGNVVDTAFDFSVGVDTSTMFDDVEEPSAGDLVAAVLSGNFYNLIQGVINSVGSPELELGVPVALLIDALGAPILGWNALADSANAIFGDLRDGDWWGAFAGTFTAPAHVIDAALNGSGVPLDFLSAFGFSPDDLVGEKFDLGSEPVDVPVLGTGTAHLGYITVKAVDGTIPLGGLLAQLAHPEINGTLQYSGGQVVFDERCFPIIGCSTTPPIDIKSDPDTFDIARELTGTPIGGILPAWLNWLPQQFADAITLSATAESAQATADLFGFGLGLTG